MSETTGMTKDRFWEIIDEARHAEGAWVEMYEALVGLLVRLGISDIMRWHQIFSLYQSLSYKNKLWAAAYLIRGGCSDDNFDYFRAWLTAQGKQIFLAVLADPDVLAIGDSMDLAAYDGEDYTFELLLNAAADAYSRKRRLSAIDRDEFYVELGNHPIDDETKAEIVGEIVYADNIDFEWEETNLNTLLPKLHRIFANVVAISEAVFQAEKHLYAAQECNKNGDYDAAVNECESALALVEANELEGDIRFDCYYRMAVNHMNADAEAEAIGWYDKALAAYAEKEPAKYAETDGDMRLYYWRGWCRLHIGDYGGALADFQTSLSVGGVGEPYRGDIHCSIGAIYYTEEQYAESLSAYNLALAENAQSGSEAFQMYTVDEALYRRATALYGLKEYKEALRGCADIMRVNGEYWDAYRLASFCLPVLGEAELANEMEVIHDASHCHDVNEAIERITKFLGDKPEESRQPHKSQKKNSGRFGGLFR